MKPRLLLIAYRAFGDWIYTVPVLPHLFEKYEVHLETNSKGWMLMHDDPRFASKQFFVYEGFPVEKHHEVVFERWKEREAEGYDRVINLWRTLETQCIAETYQPEFFAPVEERRRVFGPRSFYDAVFEKCGIVPPKKPKLDCMYFHRHEIAWGEQFAENYKGYFKIMVPLFGTCSHKVVPYMKEYTERILKAYPAAMIFLCCESIFKDYLWKHERIRHVFVDQIPAKQGVIMAKYVDMAIGPETGLMVAAGMWGTPKIMLATASSVHQMTKYQDNDYSVQSSCECSPCHRSIYNYGDCDRMRLVGEEDGEDVFYPDCVFMHDASYIMDITEKVYNDKHTYNRAYADKYIERGKSDIGKALYEKRWELIEKYCNGHKKLLDYGCASGAFHKSARNGFDTSGYDINPYYDFKEMPDKSFDILTMWDVAEHLVDPASTIKEINAEWLFLCTPSTEDVVKLKEWRHYRPDEHLHYFDPKSISFMLHKAGYDVVEINYDEGTIRNPQRPHDIMTVVARRK